MKIQNLLDSGYTEELSYHVVKIFGGRCDRMFRKTMVKMGGRSNGYIKTPLFHVVAMYYDWENHAETPSAFAVKGRFFDKPDGKLFWDCEINGILEDDDITILHIEEKMWDMFNKMGFIPDPLNQE